MGEKKALFSPPKYHRGGLGLMIVLLSAVLAPEEEEVVAMEVGSPPPPPPPPLPKKSSAPGQSEPPARIGTKLCAEPPGSKADPHDPKSEYWQHFTLRGRVRRCCWG